MVLYYTDTMVLHITSTKKQLDTIILHYPHTIVLHNTSTMKQLDTYTGIALTTIPDTILLHYMLLHNTDIIERRHDIAQY